MVDAAGAGQLRALLVFGENPAATDANLNHVRRCLSSAELRRAERVVRICERRLCGRACCRRRRGPRSPAPSPTPSGACSGSCRRCPHPVQALADWDDPRPPRATRACAGRTRTDRTAYAGWNYASSAHVLDEIAALTPSYAGVSDARLARGDALHWPVTGAARMRARRSCTSTGSPTDSAVSIHANTSPPTNCPTARSRSC